MGTVPPRGKPLIGYKLFLNILFLFISFQTVALASHRHFQHHYHQNGQIQQITNGTLGPDSAPSMNDAIPVDILAAVDGPLPHGVFGRQIISTNSSGQTGGGSAASSSGDFTCGPNKPCGNGACCGTSGWCGYEPKYCGDGCQSNCDAKAECGTYAATPGQTCPLNVCCSQYGFCGTTSEFCGDGCQTNCLQPKPSVRETNTQKKIVAYYEGWSMGRTCGRMAPEEIPVESISHLIMAFGFITPDEFKVTNMDEVAPDMFQKVTDLKSRNPNLRIMIALGGWTFNDPGKWQPVFSDLVSSESKRQKFITNLFGFLSEYGFDGVDFDWEYPGAKDRGGNLDDGINFTQFLKELRAAINTSGRDYLVTYTAPTSYWYLQHFDIKGMSLYVDWVNLMSYDLHGVWDSDNPIGNQVLAHTNLTEIDLALDLFWRNDIDPWSIVLGMGFYGRSFKLSDPNCWKPGCKFSGAGDEGPCTKTGGILSYSEITDIVKATRAKPYYDTESEVNYLVYGQNNWISYDDPKSLQAKVDFANKRGLNGLMIWAIDLDDAKHSALSALTGDEVFSDDPLAMLDSDKVVGHSTDDPSKCRITDCEGYCTQGETAVGRVKKSGGTACKGGSSKARWICCPAWTSLTPEQCRWDRGRGAVKTDCAGQCSIGEIKVTGDSHGWKGDLKDGEYDFQCLRGGKVFCCNAGNLQRYLDICTWTECGAACPSDKQNVLTTDSGGPKGNKRCDKTGGSNGGSPFDPVQGDTGRRKLCCPKKDQFNHCSWKKGGVCSESCKDYQITLDTDPQGSGGKYCDNGREQVFCCDAPGGANRTFSPVDLDKIFPAEYLPAADSIPSFDLKGFNGRAPVGDSDPNNTGVAFFLIAGSGTLSGSLNKREAPGLHFLDCPRDILEVPVNEKQKVRLICLDGDVEKCFNILTGGVEGTIVHMPDECGGGSFSRAIALEPSQDQSIPVELAFSGSVSAVYDFYFDYNVDLIRRDAGSFSIRVDYSNVAGYWDAIVDSPGVSKRDLNELVDRFYSSNIDGWKDKFDALSPSESTSTSIKQDLKRLLFHDEQLCTTANGEEGEGIAVAISGDADVQAYYGFSMIATWQPGSTVEIHQAAGFYHAEGTTSATFKVSGTGILDTSQKLENGGILSKKFGTVRLQGHSLYHGWATFEPYMQQGIKLKTSGPNNQAAVNFDGYMEVSAVADWGGSNVIFPSTPSGFEIKKTIAEKGDSKLNPLGDTSKYSTIAVANTLQLGLDITLAFQKPYQFAVEGALPDMSITQTLISTFQLEGKGSQVCLDTFVGVENSAQLVDGAYVGWDASYDRRFVSELDQVGGTDCFAGLTKLRRDEAIDKEVIRKKRQGNSTPGPPLNPTDPELPSLSDLLHEDIYNSLTPSVQCNACGSCSISVEIRDCCGCVWLAPDAQGSMDYWDDFSDGNLKRSSMPLASDTDDLGLWAIEHSNLDVFSEIEARGQGGVRDGSKRMYICQLPNAAVPIVVFSDNYPSYPDYYRNPGNTIGPNFELYYGTVKKYFHNSSSVCTSFDVSQATTFDRVYTYPKRGTRGTAYHQTYNTEHVFESQTITRFLDGWLAASAQTRRECTWVMDWILKPNEIWGVNNDADTRFNSPLGLMIDELGCNNKLDRLTLLLSRVNGHKGRLFGGKVAITSDTFLDTYTAGDEQLTIAREIGMIFTYMNIDTVWESFCDSYNGILTVLTTFDREYAGLGGATTSELRLEWPKFIRSELDRVVRDARANLKLLDQKRLPAGAIFTQRWRTIMNPNGGEIQKIKLDRTDKCRNLPASTVGPVV